MPEITSIIAEPVLEVAERQPPAPERTSVGMALSTVRYLMRTEVHTFAFSVAANAILSFFPFVVLLMTLIRDVFHSRVMYNVVVELLRDSLPAGPGLRHSQCHRHG